MNFVFVTQNSLLVFATLLLISASCTSLLFIIVHKHLKLFTCSIISPTILVYYLITLMQHTRYLVLLNFLLAAQDRRKRYFIYVHGFQVRISDTEFFHLGFAFFNNLIYVYYEKQRAQAPPFPFIMKVFNILLFLITVFTLLLQMCCTILVSFPSILLSVNISHSFVWKHCQKLFRGLGKLQIFFLLLYSCLSYLVLYFSLFHHICIINPLCEFFSVFFTCFRIFFSIIFSSSFIPTLSIVISQSLLQCFVHPLLKIGTIIAFC